MPIGISEFNVKKSDVMNDIKNNFDESKHDRLKSAISKIEDNVTIYGRQPQLHSEYEKIEEIDGYTVYRKWVGSSLARFFFAIEGTEMTLVSVLPKDDNTYKFSNYQSRVEEL